MLLMGDGVQVAAGSRLAPLEGDACPGASSLVRAACWGRLGHGSGERSPTEVIVEVAA
jgi:hypothetical protein